ncbi:MAG: thymidine phosphorylase [Anaerolineae bacterium]|nr:thymidine phosphorylase [Anaerolineae bacterium]
MRAIDIIIKKRDGYELEKSEIDFFIQGYARDDIPDYQASAWAMAVLLKGMTRQETIDLATSMAASGETLDLHDVAPLVVDKHSTGGVGDKTTLVVAPLVAACGLPVGKMSGRGLGFSGGTLDKLEAIPGYIVSLDIDRFKTQLRDVGIVVAGQTKALAPADGKLYALRDVTGTVPSLPLIASSIMSKKIAAGADAIVLDVKTGSGAFMKTLAEAQSLARIMVDIGKGVRRRVSAVLSDMSQPLGMAVGNALEVVEAVNTLRGQGPVDFLEHCLVVAEQMLLLGEKVSDVAAARTVLTEALESGRARKKFWEWIAAQGGDISVLDDPPAMGTANIVQAIAAPRTGVIAAINAMEVGWATVELGAGRLKKGDPVDHSVGVVLEAKVGDRVKKGDVLLTIHANDASRLKVARERLLAAYDWTEGDVEPPPLVHEVIQ